MPSNFSTNHNFLGDIFAGMALKLEKVGSFFFFQVSVMSILAINSNRWQETVSIAKYSVDHYLEFS